ncbi:mitochondrial tRNA methylthiotransferase CDK5RAP1 [Athalia rosae]|uniref:mitochondrial tRNA methylthiotransferase CDK5RAP1 n=1 Tax=Athalia rosae TaxID=37344 RepID=UPI0020347805|nr:mitochondrial tRNA methylthiotransferase CDK5RAP1 [Athalia rosae]
MNALKCIYCSFGLHLRSRKFGKLTAENRNVSDKFWRQSLSGHNLLNHRNVNGLASNTHEASSADVESHSGIMTKAKKAFTDISEGPNLKDFIRSGCDSYVVEVDDIPYLKQSFGNNRKVFFEIYGCQMNVNDTEIIWSILKQAGFQKIDNVQEADVILIVTCAIRDGAEQKIWHKLEHLKGLKRSRTQKNKAPLKVGLLGCMAERLKHKIFEMDQTVDLIAGPDSYKDLPRLLSIVEKNDTAVNVILSWDETYADVRPVRLNQDAVTAFVSIMRGCDNMCSYCVVPFTRGRERSRPIESILNEISHLSDQGVKEVTLLGQNVNSYRDLSESKFTMGGNESSTKLSEGFKTVYKTKTGGLRFADLLDKVSRINPEMRIRFTSPHPKDFPDEVLRLIAERPNICRSIHLPAQSGSSKVLDRMRRGYTREAYLTLVDKIRDILPGVTLSSDFICGFCGETEEEFADTISLMRIVKYNIGYLFAYSMREKTTAHRRYQDDVEQTVKMSRLREMIQVYRKEAEKLNHAEIGQYHLVLVEGRSKKSEFYLEGRTDGNIKVIIPAGEIEDSGSSNETRIIKPGDYVLVQILNGNSQVLKGIPLHHSSITQSTVNENRRKNTMYDRS